MSLYAGLLLGAATKKMRQLIFLLQGRAFGGKAYAAVELVHPDRRRRRFFARNFFKGTFPGASVRPGHAGCPEAVAVGSRIWPLVQERHDVSHQRRKRCSG